MIYIKNMVTPTHATNSYGKTWDYSSGIIFATLLFPFLDWRSMEKVKSLFTFPFLKRTTEEQDITHFFKS